MSDIVLLPAVTAPAWLMKLEPVLFLIFVPGLYVVIATFFGCPFCPQPDMAWPLTLAGVVWRWVFPLTCDFCGETSREVVGKRWTHHDPGKHDEGEADVVEFKSCRDCHPALSDSVADVQAELCEVGKE